MMEAETPHGWCYLFPPLVTSLLFWLQVTNSAAVVPPVAFWELLLYPLISSLLFKSMEITSQLTIYMTRAVTDTLKPWL